MRNGRNVLLDFLNLYLQIKIRVATFDANHPATDSTQSIAASVQKLPYSVVIIQHILPLTESICQGETIGLSISMRLSVDFVHVMYITDKQSLLFNFICNLLRTGRGS
jgi:hypothetical protein